MLAQRERERRAAEHSADRGGEEEKEEGREKKTDRESGNTANVTKDNRTEPEHSGAEHNTPEQAVIVLCWTDPGASQQALHDEWAWP